MATFCIRCFCFPGFVRRAVMNVEEQERFESDDPRHRDRMFLREHHDHWAKLR